MTYVGCYLFSKELYKLCNPGRHEQVSSMSSAEKTRNTRVLHDVPKRIDTPNQPIFVKIANIKNEQDRYIVDGRLYVFVPRFKCDFENVQRILGNDLSRFIVHDVYTTHFTAFVSRE